MVGSCPTYGGHRCFPPFAANPSDDLPSGIPYLATIRLKSVVQRMRGVGKDQYCEADESHEGRSDKNPECEPSDHTYTLPIQTGNRGTVASLCAGAWLLSPNRPAVIHELPRSPILGN